MSAALRTGLALLQRQGRAGTRDLALTALGVALPVALMLVLAGIVGGLAQRDDRAAWREPVAARGAATFVQQRSYDAFLGERVDRVDLAPVDVPDAGSTVAASTPAPPGMTAFPGPGEVWLSPALATAVASHADAELADRWPGAVVGTIADGGLARPDELVVVVGHAAGALEASARTRAPDFVAPFEPSRAVAADGFATVATGRATLDPIRDLAVIGAVLLVVPALQLSAAAARFTSNRRSVRLAALRLAGATPGQILAMAAVEAVLASGIGAIVGIAAAAALQVPLTRVPLGGGTWFVGDLWPGAAAGAAIAVVVVVLNTVGVLLTLRRTASAPLGVVTGQRRRRPSALRLVAAAAMWVAFVVTVAGLRAGGSVWPLAVGTAAIIASIAVVGPWLTWVLGAISARLARRTPLLLGARRLQADPVGAFRPVAGIVLVGFLAGLVLTVLPAIDEQAASGFSRTGAGRTELVLRATAMDDPTSELDGWTPPLRTEAERRVGDRAAEPIEVDRDGLHVVVATDDVEAARTALTGLVPGHPAITERDFRWSERVLIDDIGRASGAAVLTMVVLALIATALAAAADILEQRATLRALHLAGAEASVLQRARNWQASLPLGGATLLSVASGAAAGLLLLLAFRRDPLPTVPVVPLLGLVIAGPIAGLVAATATRPLLESATAA